MTQQPKCKNQLELATDYYTKRNASRYIQRGTHFSSATAVLVRLTFCCVEKCVVALEVCLLVIFTPCLALRHFSSTRHIGCSLHTPIRPPASCPTSRPKNTWSSGYGDSLWQGSPLWGRCCSLGSVAAAHRRSWSKVDITLLIGWWSIGSTWLAVGPGRVCWLKGGGTWFCRAQAVTVWAIYSPQNCHLFPPGFRKKWNITSTTTVYQLPGI